MAKTLLQVTPQWMNNGVFTQISNIKIFEWNTSPMENNLDYYGNRSGDKATSPLVDKMIKDEVLSDESLGSLARIAVSKYGDNWERLWGAISEKYKPLENYSMTETEDITKNDTENTISSGSSRITSTGSNTGTGSSNSSDTINGTNTSEQNNNGKIYGFNSSTGKNSTDEQTTVTSNEQNTVTSTNGSTTTSQRNDESNQSNEGASERESNGTNHRTTTRSGNMGVTTSQQMLESEWELRKRTFMEYIYDCIDKVLTSPIYI